MSDHHSGKLARLGVSRASLGLTILATWQAGALTGKEPLVMSRTERGPRVAARIGQPGQERRTHRGWEVYGEQMVVLANTSQSDARLVAERYQSAVADSRRQLELLTGPLPRGNRARGSVQITVDNATWKGDEPAPLIRRSGYAESVYLNVGPGQPPLESQLDHLTQAAAVLVVDTYLAGSAVPESLRVGLANFLAPQADVLLAGAPPRSTTGTSLLGTGQTGTAGQVYQQLRADSVARGRHPWEKADPAAQGAIERGDGAAGAEVTSSQELVEFLLTGYDGRFAATFGNALRAAILQQETDLQIHRIRPGKDAATPQVSSELTELVENLQPQYEAWQQDHSVGQPRWEPLEKDNPQLSERQRELLFVLRLLQRSTTGMARQVEPRIIEVNANGGTARPATPSRGRSIDLAQWLRTASQSTDRWAIVDSNGLLVWNHDSEPLRQRLALESERYAAAWRDGRIVVRENLGGGRTLEAWLDSNPADTLGPTARFALRTEN